MKVAVVAGTLVDTQMGVDYLGRKNPDIETIFLPMGKNPRETHTFEMAGGEEKLRRTEELFLPLIEQGVENFFVYCNSLSATVDYEAIAAKYGVKIVTPKSAYLALAGKYNNIGLIAANSQATKWIEAVCSSANPACYVVGTGFLQLVESVEAKLAPAEIVKKFRLDALCKTFEAAGCQTVALGCTHFPYFKDELQAVTSLPVFDPADIMYKALLED